MIYEFVIAIGTIILLALIWTILTHAIYDIRTNFISMTPNITNPTNQTQNMINTYNLYFNVIYFSLFFLTIIILIWVIKKSTKQSYRGEEYG